MNLNLLAVCILQLTVIQGPLKRTWARFPPRRSFSLRFFFCFFPSRPRLCLSLSQRLIAPLTHLRVAVTPVRSCRTPVQGQEHHATLVWRRLTRVFSATDSTQKSANPSSRDSRLLLTIFRVYPRSCTTRRHITLRKRRISID